MRCGDLVAALFLDPAQHDMREELSASGCADRELGRLKQASELGRALVHYDPRGEFKETSSEGDQISLAVGQRLPHAQSRLHCAMALGPPSRRRTASHPLGPGSAPARRVRPLRFTARPLQIDSPRASCMTLWAAAAVSAHQAALLHQQGP